MKTEKTGIMPSSRIASRTKPQIKSSADFDVSDVDPAAAPPAEQAFERKPAAKNIAPLSARGAADLDDTSMHTIGQRLGTIRKAAGLTQVEFASRLGTTQPSLARFEKDATLPNLATVLRYAHALGCDALAEVKLEGDGIRIVSALDDVLAELTRLRKDLGMTQAQVAGRMGTTQPIIARLEGGTGVPNLSTLERYSAAIGGVLGIRVFQRGQKMPVRAARRDS